jgi:replicative DNA helicase
MSKIDYWKKLQEQIERGKQGLNTGIPFSGFTTLSDQIDNIQQARYDLIFAGTGVGKSAFIDSTYIYGAIDFLQQNPNYIHKLKIIYYSLEIPPEDQIAKHIARLIWKHHGILTTVKEIKSRGNSNIPKDVEILIEQYKDEMQEIQDKYITYRTSLNPDFLYKDIMSYAEKKGTIVRNEDGIILQYIPKDPGLITLIVVDHFGLMDKGKYHSQKEAIDQASHYLVKFRNWFGFSPLAIFQSNRSNEGMDRRADDNWEPQISDIKDSGNPGQDANTILGIASPYNFKVDTYRGFDITRYKDRYRMLKICKNRDGTPGLVASFLFVGEIGSFYQLPKAEDIVGKPEELKKIDEYYKRKHGG